MKPSTLRVPIRGLFCAVVVLCTGGFTECFRPNAVVEEPRITVVPGLLNTRIVPGSTLQVPVTARLAGGPSRATLSIGGTLPTGVTASFTPAIVTDSMPSTMTLVADSSARSGLFVYDIVATESAPGNTLVSRSAITGEVELPFSLQTPGTQTVTVGTTREMVIGVSRKPLFQAPVGLSIDPASVPPGTTISLAPANATGANATLQLGIPASAQTGQWLVRAIGRYGATIDTLRFVMNVQAAPVPPEISVVASPATATVAPGSSSTFDLAFTRNIETAGMGNFSQTVSGLPAGATAAFTPNVPQAASQMVITTSAATPDGTYPLTVTATLGTLTKTATVTLRVETPANFAIALAPSALTVNRGASATSVLTLARTSAVGDVTVDAQSLPAGVTITAAPAVIGASITTTTLTIETSAAAVPGTYSIIVRGVAGPLLKTTTLSLTIPTPPPSSVAIAVQTPVSTVASGGTIQIPIKLTRTGNGIGQLVELRTVGIPGGGNAWVTPTFTAGDSAVLNVIGYTPGTWNVAVSVALGAIPSTDVATINVTASTTGDFAIVPAPNTFNVARNATTGAGLEINRYYGFAGAVSFGATTPAGSDLQVTFSLNSTTGVGVGMNVRAGANTPLGPHVITIRGTSGSLVHDVSYTVNVTAASNPYPYPGYPYGIKALPPY
ncbi:MAG: hypothetical protein ACO1Q7_03425 [Gemmatimonas sp.]